MKSFLTELKWLKNQSMPFFISLVIIVMNGIALSICSVSSAVASKNLIDAAVAKNLNSAIQAGALFLFLIVMQIALNALDSILSVSVIEKMSNNIRKRIYEHISNSEWSDFVKYHSDDVLTRMTSDIGVVANGVMQAVPSIISFGVRLVSAFIILFTYDRVLALLALVISPVTVLFYRLFGKKLKMFHIKIQETEGIYRAFIHESIQNMLIVKAFCIEDKSAGQMDKLQNDRLVWALKRNKLGVVANSMLAIGYWLGYCVAFGWGAMRLFAGEITFGTLTAFFQLVGQIQTPFIGLAKLFPQVIATQASAARLMELEKLKLEKREDNTPEWQSVGVDISQLNFSYEQEKPVLKNISLDICPGEIAAIVGPSGEGKTTMVRLLLSLVAPENGNLHFYNDFGEEIEAGASSRSLVSYVPQGNTLFSGTIEENLTLACPEASEQEMITALKAACAWDFVEKFNDKIKTVIGERGLGLSEGQAQRIAIARALLRKTPVLIFDEATSALDSATEMNVLKAIKNLNPARTCIIITHRPAVLKVCHKVFKLQDGVLTKVDPNVTSDSTSLSA